jgi:hypothetical protein
MIEEELKNLKDCAILKYKWMKGIKSVAEEG